jgi:hypothetical protein
MLRCWVAVFAVLYALDARAEAAELTGFGPIKFGMSKEVAWAAIDGKGSWVTKDMLEYDLPSIDGRGAFLIRQRFNDGKATDTFVEHEFGRVDMKICMGRGLQFAGEIKRKYETDPTVRVGAVRPAPALVKEAYLVEDIYAFGFDKNASIQIIASYSYETGYCDISITYRPPNENAFPF